MTNSWEAGEGDSEQFEEVEVRSLGLGSFEAMSVSDAQAPMDPGDLEPKHRVFLCHSGAQKGFVEQLDKDLRSVDQNPFFDKDRESLPIGDHFPTLIFQAIEHCNVGVVVLSEEFFMRSHWPMFEVVKMVECGRRVMPIFLGISPGDLSNEEKVANWKSKWEAWAKDNGRIDVTKWESTLRFLRPLSGLVYDHSVGEVKFREEIVKEVCKMVPSTYAWDDSHVQGMSHICKAIKEKISKTRVAKNGAQIVGVYGVGGIGKTTSCKCLCSDLVLEFDGRVCHVEFGDGTNELGRVQEVLKVLKSTNIEFLKGKKLDKCWVLLKGQLRLKKVVLAIDNVSVNSEICDEVQKYLKQEYGKGSIVMVIARGLGELENLGMKKENCLLMPELVEADARALFLYHAGAGNEADEKVVMNCIRRCYFRKGDGNGSMHYHPLALKVLGSQLVGKPPTEWQLQLEGENVFNQRREDKNPVFSVLETSFSSLMLEDRMLFMDVALFEDLSEYDSSIFDDIYDQSDSESWPMVLTDMRYEPKRYAELGLRWCTIFEWLSMVHGISVDQVKLRLNELKRRSLLEELGDGTCKIGMHDLWREFAKMKATHVVKEDWKWVYEVSEGVGLDRVLESPLGGGGRKSLRRICIEGGKFKSINFSRCSEVTVVRLQYVYVTSGVLDLSPLKSIRSLEIHQWNEKGVMHCKVEDAKEQTVEGIGQLSNLTKLLWHEFDVKLVSLVEISYLTNLQVLSLSSEDTESIVTSFTVLDLQQLRYLEVVRVAMANMVSITGFNSKMKELRSLLLAGCSSLRRCVGVGDLVSLEVLLLSGCGALEELPDLQRLTRLRILDISSCVLLDALPGLGHLVALRELRAGCDPYKSQLGLEELPCMSKLTKLERLDLSGCDKLKCITGSLISLQELVVRGDCCENLPTLKNLWKLQKVTISHMHWNGRFSETSCAGVDLGMLEFVQELTIYKMDGKLTNLCKMTALKILEVRDSPMERFPCMGKDMKLESLKFCHCSRLRNLDVTVELCCSWTLSNLKMLSLICCNALEVIDLSHFPQLRRLYVAYAYWEDMSKFVLRCHAIHLHLDTLILRSLEMKELPDLRRFPSLQCLEIFSCQLTSLTISEPLSTLSRLVLENCPELCMVPNINLIPRLTYFRVYNCGVQLNEHEVHRLKSRGFQRDRWGTVEIPSRDAALRDWRVDEEIAALSAPVDLDTALELCTSTFIRYDESLSELGRSSIPKRALEMGSDEEQAKKLKND